MERDGKLKQKLNWGELVTRSAKERCQSELDRKRLRSKVDIGKYFDAMRGEVLKGYTYISIRFLWMNLS